MAFLFPKLFPPYVGCLPETANGQLEMLLEDAMALVWRAKTLKFTASLFIEGVFEVDEVTEIYTNTYDSELNIFSTPDDGSPNPQPIDKMSDIICSDFYNTIFEDGTNFDDGRFVGSYSYLGGTGIFYSLFLNFFFGPLSVKTVGETKVCDFAYGLLFNPANEANAIPPLYVSTGIPFGGGDVTATITNGAVIVVNGNTYSTDIYCRGDSVGNEGLPFSSLTATGQILVEIESERLAE